jgi:hypothetical protein
LSFVCLLCCSPSWLSLWVFAGSVAPLFAGSVVFLVSGSSRLNNYLGCFLGFPINKSSSCVFASVMWCFSGRYTRVVYLTLSELELCCSWEYVDRSYAMHAWSMWVLRAKLCGFLPCSTNFWAGFLNKLGQFPFTFNQCTEKLKLSLSFWNKLTYQITCQLMIHL